VVLAAKAAARTAHHRLIPAWVLYFGLAGVFFVAILDAAPIPLPIPGSTDILILVLGAHGENPWLLAPAAIVGGLIGALVISVFLLPTLYVWIARPDDVLPVPETEFEN